MFNFFRIPEKLMFKWIFQPCFFVADVAARKTGAIELSVRVVPHPIKHRW